jgi:hypothetical protein
MSHPYVYRSRSPEVLDAMRAAQNSIRAYVKATGQILDDAGVGSHGVYRESSGWSVAKFRGLAVPDGEQPPHGWRMGAQYAVPDKRTKAGKQVAAALDAVKHPGDPRMALIGMPPDVSTPGGFTSPGTRFLEDGAAFYVTWRVDPATCRESFTRGTFQIDRDLWEPVLLSEYYAAVEAAGAAEKAERRAS